MVAEPSEGAGVSEGTGVSVDTGVSEGAGVSVDTGASEGAGVSVDTGTSVGAGVFGAEVQPEKAISRKHTVIMASKRRQAFLFWIFLI